MRDPGGMGGTVSSIIVFVVSQAAISAGSALQCSAVLLYIL